LLLFGSSGGGAYAFDSRTSPAQIVAVPFIGLDDEIVYGPSFEEFLVRLGNR
jgi:hypothetical protein